MLVIKETNEKRPQRIFNLLQLVDSDLPFEPLVLTPTEFQQRLNLGDQFFEEVQNKGKTLYER